MDPNINKLAAYFLRTPDGAVYGPVDMVTLCVWATDARVIPGCELSENKDIWFPVENVPEFRLNWMVQFAGGTIYGPLNLLAIRVLAEEKSIPANVQLNEKGTDRKVVLNDGILPLMVEELHQMLAGCGSLMSASLGMWRESQRALLAESDERGARFEDLQAKLARTESDMVASVMLTSELKAKCLALEGSSKLDREQAAHNAEKAAQWRKEKELVSQQLDEAKEILQKREALIQQLEKDAVEYKTQTDLQMGEMRAKMTVGEKDLLETQQRAGLLAAQLVQTQEESQKTLEAQRAASLEEMKNALQKKESQIQQQDSRFVEICGKNEQLEKELKETKQGAGLLSGKLVQIQESYQVLMKESARKESENSDKLRRIEKEIKDSTELVAKTMREMEQRESQLRDLQGRMDQKEGTVSNSGKVVDAEVIHAEVLPVEQQGPKDAEDWMVSPGGKGGPPRESGEKANKSKVLNGVEAQLQKELKQWEILKREQSPRKTSSPKWF